MRDPARIARILEKLEVLWNTQQDSRLCQLISNITYGEACRSGGNQDCFYVEDDNLENQIDRELLEFRQHG